MEKFRKFINSCVAENGFEFSKEEFNNAVIAAVLVAATFIIGSIVF